jgi:hypothetical protein
MRESSGTKAETAFSIGFQPCGLKQVEALYVLSVITSS